MDKTVSFLLQGIVANQSGTGSDSDAMDLIAANWNAVKLPLSINYRCSKAVVRNAQKLVPDIEAWNQAPEGSVGTIDGDFLLREFEQTDAVMCRVILRTSSCSNA